MAPKKHISQFQEVVVKYIDYDRLEGGRDTRKVNELAEEFGCSATTIVEWAAGVTDPPNVIKLLVMESIENKA